MRPSLPPSPPPSSNSINLESEEVINLLALQQHQQIWQNAILPFCFSFALEISLKFPQTDESNNIPHSLALLSLAVLHTFSLQFVALFIRQKHPTTSTVMQNIAVFLAAAAFCLAIAIPFPLKLKYVAWALFFISWIFVGVYTLMNITIGFIHGKLKTILTSIIPLFLPFCPKSNPSLLSSTMTNIESPPSVPPSPPPSSTSFNLDSEEVQQHQQIWQNAILTFCFSFALEFSLQFLQYDESNNIPASLLLLSFAVLLTFSLHFVSLFVGQKNVSTSIVVHNIAVFLATAAVHHAIAIRFPFMLKCVAWAMFFISWIVIVICQLNV